MDKVNYSSNSTTAQNGKYPITIEGLEFIQSQILALQGIAFCGGDNYVIKEPTTEPVTCGIMVWDGEVLPLSGIPANYVQIITTTSSITTDRGVYADVREMRVAQYTAQDEGTPETATLRLRTGFAELESNASLSTKVAALQEVTYSKLATIKISNFDTFNPSTIPELVALKVGESCNFHATSLAIGQPVGIRGFVGFIFKLSQEGYRFLAFSSIQITQEKNFFASRIYGSSGPKSGWLFFTDLASVMKNGHALLASGVMLQWGTSESPSTGFLNVTFPVAFASTPYYINAHVALDALYPGPNNTSLFPITVIKMSATSMSVVTQRYALDSLSPAAFPFHWFAIGKSL